MIVIKVETTLNGDWTVAVEHVVGMRRKLIHVASYHKHAVDGLSDAVRLTLGSIPSGYLVNEPEETGR